MAARFNNQGNLAALIPAIDEGLMWKPCTRVEGACCSGALALVSGIKSVLAETADMVLAVGVEVQNTVKAIYGADILATAGWSRERKAGHAYFFPGKFSDRAGACYDKYGRERTRRAMARWYRNAIENARLCPTAQEYHNAVKDLEAVALAEPNPAAFVDHLNVYDCSKVSDGASAIAIASEEGLAPRGDREAGRRGDRRRSGRSRPISPARPKTSRAWRRHAGRWSRRCRSAGIAPAHLATVRDARLLHHRRHPRSGSDRPREAGGRAGLRPRGMQRARRGGAVQHHRRADRVGSPDRRHRRAPGRDGVGAADREGRREPGAMFHPTARSACP